MKQGLLNRFIRHRVAANVLMLLAFVVGIVGILRMNVQFFPSFDLDIISVRVVWIGASSEDVERAITTPLEERLRSINGLKRMSSTSTQGIAAITLELHEGTDPLLALDEARQQVDEFRNLPRDAETPQVSRISRYDLIARLLIRGDRLDELRPWVRQFETELLAAGIDRVTINGLPSEQISIEVPAAALASTGMGLPDIAERVGRLARDLPAGVAGEQDGAREIRALEQRRDAQGYASLPLLSDEHGLLRLGDIAEIRREARPGNVSLRQQDGVVVEMLLERSESGHSLKAARILQGWLDDTVPGLPPGLAVEVYDTQWELIRDRIVLLLKNGLGGLVLVLLVLYLFLPARVAFWVAVGIPTAFMATLGLMLLFGGSINMMSLFALIMALGIIVDDAIVVSEDADTHRKMGEGPEQAALGGARRMFWPVVASSLTTVAAFLPLMMIGGIMGNILFDIPFVMIMVIMAALLESFLILPNHLKLALRGTLSQQVSPLRQRLDQGFERFRDGYFRPLVTLALHWRGTTVALTLAVMILSIGLLAGGRMQFTFFPSPEAQLLYANANFVAGTPRAHTEAFLGELERALYETEAELGGGLINAAVAQLGAATGSGAGVGARGDQLASMIVEMLPSERRTVRNEEFIRVWRAKIAQASGIEGLTITARQAGPPGRDLTVRLSGGDPETLKAAALELSASLLTIPGVTDVEDDMPFGREQLIYRLTPTGEVLGFTTESLALQLRAAFDGSLAQLVQDGKDELEVRVMLPRDERERLDVFDRIDVRAPNGQFVALASVASWESRRGFEALRHADGQLAVEVSGEVDSSRSNANAIIAEISREALPALARHYGIQYSFEGRAADQRETFADMITGLVLGLGLIYLVLVWSFSSWSWPVVVMAAIPLGLTGAIIGHWVMGINLTIMSLFGLFALSGIVVNNAIILVSFFKEQCRKGLAVREALIEAACGRLRAVMLTSLTTIGGLTPLMFESSLQAQFLIPMAASITFGLGFATILVLFFIPALLSLIEGGKRCLAEQLQAATNPAPGAAS
ncbi:MAG: efflux RND transporter permease subunit [Thiohalomonadaceae bacterium]